MNTSSLQVNKLSFCAGIVRPDQCLALRLDLVPLEFLDANIAPCSARYGGLASIISTHCILPPTFSLKSMINAEGGRSL